MIGKLLTDIRSNGFTIPILLWVLLCVLPWAFWLESLPWIRIGLGILVFLTPGLAASMLLAGERFDLPGHLAIGLVLSVFLVGGIGLSGRILHMPFDWIKPIVAVTGSIILMALFRHSGRGRQMYKPMSFSAVSGILLFPIVFGIVVNFQGEFRGDDLSYLAYLTSWQHAQPLDFKEVIFGSGDIDPIRFWPAMLPMNWAVLAETCNLHGLLLLGFYLEPFLMAFSVLATYVLYKEFLHSESQTIAAVLLQFTLLFLLWGNLRQPGYVFFNRLSEDKVFAAFILAPVFFLVVRRFLEWSTLRTAALVLLCGMGLALTHPVMLAYGVFIAGGYAGFVAVIKREYRKLGVVLVLLAIVILPLAALRFIDVPWVSRYIFGLKAAQERPGVFDLESALDTRGIDTRISYLESTPFYSFPLEILKTRTNNPEQESLLEGILSWSYVGVLGFGLLWSLFNVRKADAAPLVASASTLILLCAIPYTGWLVGYVVSARMLWRSPWLLPMGLTGVILLTEALRLAGRSMPPESRFRTVGEHAALGLISVLCVVLIGYFSARVYGIQWRTSADIAGYRNRLVELSVLGSYLEENIEQPAVFAAPAEIMSYLPGLSSKSKVAFFRDSVFTPYPVDPEKINLILSLDPAILIGERISVLERYKIQYILFQEDALREYYAGYPECFVAQRTGSYWILRYHAEGP